MKTRLSPLKAALGITLSAAMLSACGSAGTLSDEESEEQVIVVGSQDYYSNEIIAEIYSQALENNGYQVQRDLRIGQREVYMSEIENGEVDLFPEYTGPLLQYWQPDAAERQSEEVHEALVAAAPEGLNILDQAKATDQDAYVITREFAEEHGISTIEDLAKVNEPMTLGANSEAESRPNGPEGLAAAYGVEVGFTPIEDGGGPLTVKALKDNDVQIAIIYTADPAIQDEDLVVLEDPAGLFLASHVVPVASDAVDEEAREIINQVSAALSAEELVFLNSRSVNEQANADTIATEWLEEDSAVG